MVDLPSDALKGRIIGREGRNIRALEVATGVELIVDDTPGGSKTGHRVLVADGRINPARIEGVVARVRAEVDDASQEGGRGGGF